MIVAQKDADFSFMPLQTQGRGLDLSRFDTGGVENANRRSNWARICFQTGGSTGLARRRIWELSRGPQTGRHRWQACRSK
jgi:hypothetical protein